MKSLSRHQVILLHSQLLVETGGADGIRDEGLLDAALDSPYSGFGNTQFYPTIEARAARLAFGLVNNHPFVDGNKRIGVLAMLVLLDLNDIALDVTDNDLIWLGVSLAEGNLDSEGVHDWIKQHTFGKPIG